MTNHADKWRVRTLFVISILGFSLSAWASLEPFLDFLENGMNSSANICSEDETAWGRDSVENVPVKLDCPNDLFKDKFYQTLSYNFCQKRFWKSAQSCTELDPSKILSRSQNSLLINEMENFANVNFIKYKHKLSASCCKGKSQCLNRFNSTELVFTDKTTSRAEYMSDSNANGLNRVQISRGKLASAMNKESLERVLLVELGHACQFALISESTSEYKEFTTNRCSVESGKKMFLEGLGPEVGSCVDKELQSQISAIPESERGKYCFGKWYREAFSDMKFRSEFKSIYHWIYDFNRRSQHKNYASVYKYVGCGMTDNIRSQVCK